MKKRLIRAFIFSGISGLLNYIGSVSPGGEGFFPDKSQPAPGFDSTVFVMALIIGWGIGFIPWGDLRNLFKRKN